MLRNYLSLIKFSHTIFALPFALVGFSLAVQRTGWTDFPVGLLFYVLGCMVFARTAAMAFNRYLDRDIDAQNARTAVREIPAGVIAPGRALFFVVLNGVAFVGCAYLINPLCFYLSPVALLVILGYSYTKRFTWLCHFVLGLGLALAPVGAWLAVTAQFAWLPVLYGLAVLFWVSGFDIIYALQDEAFDREMRLYSVPVRLGRVRSLRLARVLHVVCGGLMLVALDLVSEQYPAVGWLAMVATVVFLLLLVNQHRLVKPTDLSRIDLAFFTTNGIASVVFGTLLILDLFV